MIANKIASAINELADTCNAAAGDLHLLHFVVRGVEFDTLHKEVVKTYYESMADDYDSLVEFALCGGEDFDVGTPNESAKRIGWSSLEGTKFNRAEVVMHCEEVISKAVRTMVDLYKTLNTIDDNPYAIGVANWLQGRIEYWMKEVLYFNARRAE